MSKIIYKDRLYGNGDIDISRMVETEVITDGNWGNANATEIWKLPSIDCLDNIFPSGYQYKPNTMYTTYHNNKAETYLFALVGTTSQPGIDVWHMIYHYKMVRIDRPIINGYAVRYTDLFNYDDISGEYVIKSHEDIASAIGLDDLNTNVGSNEGYYFLDIDNLVLYRYGYQTYNNYWWYADYSGLDIGKMKISSANYELIKNSGIVTDTFIEWLIN